MDSNDYDILVKLRRSFNEGITRPLKWRKQQLKAIIQFTLIEREHIIEALSIDLGKSEHESDMFELAKIRVEAKWALKNLKVWMKEEKVNSSISYCIYEKYVINEPYGIVLVISPWNYPVLLSINPIIAAIAAGNCVVLKPSEYSTACSRLLYEILPKYLDERCTAVKLCGAQETSSLIKSGLFDHIAFTGSSNVGSLVMEAAAKNLIPVTLECGGKSPCIVLSDCDLLKAAKSVCYGKFLNAGQTCIAPDYVLIESSVKDAFISLMQNVIAEWYHNQEIGIGKIINEQHFNRIMSYLDGDNLKIIGGLHDRNKLLIFPTIVDDPDDEHILMKEEIFGPILPVKPISNFYQAIDIVNSKPKPLTIYVYTKSKKIINKIIETTSSGSVTVNDCIVQVAIPNVPFGGVGLSGINRLNWVDGFQTFSNKKAVVKRPEMFDLVNSKLLYPPYTDRKTKLMLKIIECTDSGKSARTVMKVFVYIGFATLLVSFGYILGRLTE